MMSLKTTLHEATRPDAEMHAEFMGKLQIEIIEIAEILEATYAHLNKAVKISYSNEYFNQVYLYYDLDHYPGDAYDVLRKQCDDSGEDIDNYVVLDHHFWCVQLDTAKKKFTLRYSSFSPEDLFSETSASPEEDDHDDKNAKETFPATEEGYQKLICQLGAVLKKFMGTEVGVIYFQKSSERQWQQTLDL